MVRVKFQVGDVSIECEGSEDFCRNEVDRMLVVVRERSAVWPAQTGSAPLVAVPAGDSSMGRVAAALRPLNGPALILASLAFRVVVEGKASVLRAELLETMRSASGYYKATFANNLTAYLTRMIRAGVVYEAAAGAFTLSVPSREQVTAELKEAGVIE